MTAPDHIHRERAQEYWQEEANPAVAFNAVTMLGLVRICSNAPIFAGERIQPEAAWGILQNWMQMAEVSYLPEPSECRETLDELVTAGLVIRRTWTDSYLAAFAMSGDLRLISFDDDFARFPDLDFLHLTHN